MKTWLKTMKVGGHYRGLDEGPEISVEEVSLGPDAGCSSRICRTWIRLCICVSLYLCET